MDMSMTEKEIRKRIASEERRIKHRRDTIVSLEYDIKACQKAIDFWKGELKRVNGGKRKTS